MKKIAAVLGIVIFAIILTRAVYDLPVFGSYQNKDVSTYYLWHGLHETGSANIVNSVVWDFRGYDTLGEETVLFTAAVGIFLVMRRVNGRNNKGD